MYHHSREMSASHIITRLNLSLRWGIPIKCNSPGYFLLVRLPIKLISQSINQSIIMSRIYLPPPKIGRGLISDWIATN